jgi:hypothetical protein
VPPVYPTPSNGERSSKMFPFVFRSKTARRCRTNDNACPRSVAYTWDLPDDADFIGAVDIICFDERPSAILAIMNVAAGCSLQSSFGSNFLSELSDPQFVGMEGVAPENGNPNTRLLQ